MHESLRDRRCFFFLES